MAHPAAQITVNDFYIPKTLTPKPLAEQEREVVFARLVALLKQQNATIIAHYYTDPDIQRLAEASGGFIGDSLAMAQYGYESQADTLVVAGVKFMGETAKILSPKKRVLMPTLEATCSLDLGCLPDEFAAFRQQYPERTVVVYANTSAAVKAQADWVVTSSNALAIVDHLDAEGQTILWAPDRYLGRYIQKQTGADMVLWQGACIVHEEFKVQGVAQLKTQYPNAAVLVHPESPEEMVAVADVVGSTTRLLQASQELSADTFIVATDRGIFYKMQQASPQKTFIEAPTAGHGASCRSCAHCPWMAMNDLQKLEQTLLTLDNEIQIDASLIDRARLPLERMLNFSAQPA